MHLFSRFYSTTEFIFTVYMRTPSAIIGLNFPASIIFLLFVFFAPAVAQPPLKPAIVMETSPYFEKPAAGLLPKGFVEKRDMCQTDSSIVDSLGQPWFRIARDGERFWLLAKNIRFLADIPGDFLSQQSQGDDDKKRRSRILQKNPLWPHRIKMAVRSGQICLDMTEEQLIAAWGQPVQKGAMFTVGLGEYDYRLFQAASGNYLIVTLHGGRVMGWSMER